MAAVRIPKSVAKQLAEFFHRNGYVRQVNLERRAEVTAQVYKKGDEVRLVASSPDELEVIQQLLLGAGFKFGKPFQKDQQLRQPIYGRAEVARFLSMVEKSDKASVVVKKGAKKIE
ncbi:MAG: hypothetical protein HOO97_04315 [Sideroxydans sp.]|nr:hypothetical protein [Sideroxydans sp.]